jgi:hypothetical protein
LANVPVSRYKDNGLAKVAGLGGEIEARAVRQPNVGDQQVRGSGQQVRPIELIGEIKRRIARSNTRV